MRITARTDWIEIHNAGTTPVNLDGWFLTDSAGNPTKWQFPAVTLEVGQVPGRLRLRQGPPRSDGRATYELQTQRVRRVSRPDPSGRGHRGLRYAHYPVQAATFPTGLVETAAQEILLPLGARPRPSSHAGWFPGTSVSSGRAAALDAGNLRRFRVALGHHRRRLRLYPGQIGLDVSAMQGVNSTVYIRIPFVVQDPSIFRALDSADPIRRRNDRLPQRTRSG